MSTERTPVDETIDAFVAELARWRAVRNLSKKRLAAQMGFDPSYVSHIEGRRHRPTEDFARRAEAVLRAGGAIWHCWRAYEAARRNVVRAAGREPPSEPLPPGTGLVVEREEAELRYVDGVFWATVRRLLYNAGGEPVSRYLIRIAVDRFPGEPERSNRLYREHPLTWEELRLTARCSGEPMFWRAKHDHDAFKEVWLLFENARGRFPLYPGERTMIEYRYGVGADKWGPWFQRAVRLPTRRLHVRLDFPAGLQPVVWGIETSMTAEAVPLRTAIAHREETDRSVFEWTTEDPPLHARYRLEWRFRGAEAGRRTMVGTPGSERMRAAGIVQRGAPLLRRVARPFDLPAEASIVQDVVDRLFATMGRVTDIYPFVKGMGLAAPQVGIGRAAAIVQPGDDDAEPIVLLNPRVVAESSELDEQYEGCLSFFDLRGAVPRPRHVEVEHTTLDGEPVITTYENAVARLIGHEVDHLYGRLYTDRMRDGAHLIPVEEYGHAGQPWHY